MQKEKDARGGGRGGGILEMREGGMVEYLDMHRWNSIKAENLVEKNKSFFLPENEGNCKENILDKVNHAYMPVIFNIIFYYMFIPPLLLMYISSVKTEGLVSMTECRFI